MPSNKPIVEHTIQDGDSLWKIARDYKTTVREIKAANQMTNDFIVAGQTLRVPSGLAEGVAPGTPETASASPEVPQGLPQPAAGGSAQ
jgi:LysM repeat protein